MIHELKCDEEAKKMGSAKVKICGIKTPNMAQYAVGQGADFIGVIFFPKSPRHVSYVQAAAINKAISGNAKLVAVMVNPSNDEISDMLAEFTPDYIQLHGSEPIERVVELRGNLSIPLIKAISVSTKEDIKKAHIYKEHVDYILFDAKPPKGSDLPGGNAISFDWSLLKDLNLDTKYFLSGGLNISNINDAIKQTKVKYIDISSGAESSIGEKSKKLINLLIQKVNK